MWWWCMVHGACGWSYQFITHYNVVWILISMVCPCGSGNEWCLSNVFSHYYSCNFCGHSRIGHGGCIFSVWSCNCIDVYLFMWKDLGNVMSEIVWFILEGVRQWEILTFKHCSLCWLCLDICSAVYMGTVKGSQKIWLWHQWQMAGVVALILIMVARADFYL